MDGWEEEILATRQATDVVIGLFEDLPLLAKETDGALEVPTANGPRRVAELAQDVYNNTGEIVTLFASLTASIEVESLDYPKPATERGSEVLLVPNPGRLPKAGIDAILEHLRAGGRAVLLPVVPVVTVDGESDGRILDLLDAEVDAVVPIRGAAAEDFRYKSVVGRTVDDAAIAHVIVTYRAKDGKELETLATYGGRPCAFKQPALGGELLVCGLLPRYITEDSVELFRDILLRASGIERAVSTEGDRVYVVERETDQRADGPRLVVAANVRGSEEPTRIHLRLPDGALVFPKAAPFEILPKRARCLWVNLPLGDARLVYCTSEITPLDQGRRTLLLRGDLGTDGEIAFDRDVRLTLDDQPLPLSPRDGVWLATYAHARDGRTLTLQGSA